jgi:hypothetical protein
MSSATGNRFVGERSEAAALKERQHNCEHHVRNHHRAVAVLVRDRR